MLFCEEGQLVAATPAEPLVSGGEEATSGVGHVPGAEELTAQLRASHGQADAASDAPSQVDSQDGTVLPASSSRAVFRLGDLSNDTVSIFKTCNDACDHCFLDHYQGCLAICEVGCEDYCAIKLPASKCLSKQRWSANVGHIFQTLNTSMRMCRATGFNGCPEPPRATIDPHPDYKQPYIAASHFEEGSLGHNAKNLPDEQQWNHMPVFSSFLRARK